MSTSSLAHPAPLPDGLVVIVKRECATCEMVVPVLERLQGDRGLCVVTQDDPSFPGTVERTHDADLAISWHHAIDTVPTLLRVADGNVVERTEGWLRDDWRRITGVDDLGNDLPAMRPGCGSLSVDPDRVDSLRARFESGTLRSRRIELAELDDDIEAMFARGFTDGLPVVPPTPERVLRMLSGTARRPDEIVAVVAPDLVPATVEKIAVNAVMAGCLPEYLPWVIAAVEAVCTDDFNIHGVLATTMPVGPVLICNGPGTRAIGLNSGGNALGQGTRANLTIGRAVQLVVRNIGGGRPGGVDRATHGNPGKISFCFAELEETSPFATLAESRGFDRNSDTVTAFAGEGPRLIIDQKARTAEALANSIASCLRAAHHPKLILGFDVVLVVGPEHARVFADDGWDRNRLLDELHARLLIHGSDLIAGAHGIAEGIPEHLAELTLPKFRPDGILLVHAGGTAGLFSAIIGGWANGDMGSRPVTVEVRR
ncbi:MAG: hypothetical protein RLY45_730 [Actinomycetota bacterium]